MKKTCDECTRLRKKIQQLREKLKRASPSLEVVLRRRGFTVYRKEPPDDLLVPAGEFQDRYYRMLGRYSFRLFLRDVIKHQDFFTLQQVTRFSTAKVTARYLSAIISLGLAVREKQGYSLAKRPVKSFGATLEWYVSEVMQREFFADSLRGVKFRGRQVGGDYDVISKLDGSIAYFEVKSSPPKQIYEEEVLAFLARVDDLAPETAFFFMDTELRMKDKIVPMFEQAMGRREEHHPGIVRIERELFHIRNRIFIINAKGSVAGNIGKALQSYWRT